MPNCALLQAGRVAFLTALVIVMMETQVHSLDAPMRCHESALCAGDGSLTWQVLHNEPDKSQSEFFCMTTRELEELIEGWVFPRGGLPVLCVKTKKRPISPGHVVPDSGWRLVAMAQWNESGEHVVQLRFERIVPKFGKPWDEAVFQWHFRNE
jgi:hypothetical protein